jgi:hypothetical protein
MSKLLKGAALAALLAAAVGLAVAARSELAAKSPRPDDWAAVSSFARQAERTKAVVPALSLRDHALAKLDELTRIGSTADRSHAALVAGLLELQNAGQDRANGLVHLQAAASAFQRAVRIDPENDDAAYDLELLLSRSKAEGRPVGEARPEQKTKASVGRPGTKRTGSGY